MVFKKMAKYITNQSIDSTYDYGINNGALGGKPLSGRWRLYYLQCLIKV